MTALLRVADAAFERFAVGVFSLAMLLTGCGATRAITNPAAIKSLNEPAPMGVVLRRAEVSRAVSEHVDRLTSKTPIDAVVSDAVALDAGKAKDQLTRAGAEAIYAGSPVRVLPVEAWFSAMSSACPTGEGKTLIESLGAETAARYAQVSSEVQRIAKLKAEQEALEERQIGAAPRRQHLAVLRGSPLRRRTRALVELAREVSWLLPDLPMGPPRRVPFSWRWPAAQRPAGIPRRTDPKARAW